MGNPSAKFQEKWDTGLLPVRVFSRKQYRRRKYFTYGGVDTNPNRKNDSNHRNPDILLYSYL